MALKVLPDRLIRCKPCYPHVFFVGKQRTCKDIVIVKEIFNLCREKESIFDVWFTKEYLDLYERSIKHVYANCWLDDSYLPSGCVYELVTNVETFNDLHDGLLYLHDIEMIFNSRGSLSDRDMQRLLQIVNNAGKHRLQIRASCHRNMSVDVKMRSLVNLWCRPIPYHSDDFLNSYSVALNIFDSDLVGIGFDVVDDIYRYADLYDTNEESLKLKKKI